MMIKINHILICRTDNIGDVVLTLPITALLKKHYPSARISFMCRSYAAPIVRFCRTVDEVVEYDKTTDFVGYMKGAKIDVVIFAQPEKTLAIAAFKARIPNRIGNLKYKYHWILCNRRVYFSMGSSRRHEAQLNFNFLRPLGINMIPDRASIPLLYKFDVPSENKIDELLKPHAFNLIFHPKSNGHGREWPAGHYVELAKMLADDPRIRIWVTGREEESQWLQKNAPELFQQPNVNNLCGKLSLTQLAMFIQHADGLIASGTGPLHISAAFGQNTAGLFPPRPTMFPERWGALGDRSFSICELETENCIPCKKKGFRQAMTCACMSDIQPIKLKELTSRWVNEKVGASLAAGR